MIGRPSGHHQLSRVSRRGVAAHLHPAEPAAVNIGQNQQCNRAPERGIPPPHQNPNCAALRRNRADALGADGIGPDPDAARGRLGNLGSARRPDQPCPRGLIRSKLRCSQNAAGEFPPDPIHDRPTLQVNSFFDWMWDISTSLQFHEILMLVQSNTPKKSANFVALAPDASEQGCLVDFAHTQNITAQS